MTSLVSPGESQEDEQASIAISSLGDTCVIAVYGEIDMSNADYLSAEMVRGISESGCHHLLVDLSGVRFLASDGIRVLVVLRRHVGERGGEMSLRNPTPIVRSVLDMTGVSRYLGLPPLP